MSKTTIHKTVRPTRFKLKPLLIAMPLSVLAACANNQGPVISSQAPLPSPPSVSEAINSSSTDIDSSTDTLDAQYDQIETGPDLTSNKSIQESSPEPLDNNNLPIENTEQGNNPMTVLVIENPEILSKLASESLKPAAAISNNPDITMSNNIVPITITDTSEPLSRPGKRVFHFGFNQSSLSEEDIDLIEQHAEYLKANPELQVTIHGHTDAQGNSDYNLKLSQQRAAMMVTELLKQGVKESRIKTIGWGGGYPLVNSLNFAENRRIEIEYSAVHYAANQ